MAGAHFVEQPGGQGPLRGANRVAEDDVVGEDGWRVAGHVDHPVEQR